MAGLFDQNLCTQAHVSSALPSNSDVLTARRAEADPPPAGVGSLPWGNGRRSVCANDREEELEEYLPREMRHTRD
ncbi:unnamed protein product [Ectocarpus sp. CCAP 1310/34]|nr:unnamed protein product [Ectocarpus sp. CCAP 1310/34]